MADGHVNWYGERVTAVLKDADEKILDQLAFQTLGQARINIRENRQIDTGFMTNSGYVISAQRNTYHQTWPTGEYPWKAGKHGGKPGEAYSERASQAPVDTRVESVVAFAAHYSIFLELRRSFLYQAIQDVVKHFDGIVRREKF